MIRKLVLIVGILAALALCAPALAADYEWPVLRVVDGDTVAVDASADMPPELARLSVRLLGVDTPEKGHRAKCESERDSGQAATAFTEAAIAKAQHILVHDPKWGKYGGRVLADLMLDGRSLTAALIEAGHGRPYDGGRRGSWCSAARPPPSAVDSDASALARYDDNDNRRISCKEARRHGIAPVRRQHPAYPYMQDRDGDGIVCE